MADQAKTIRFLKFWAGHTVGEIWTPEMPDQANLLVGRGVAEYVQEEKPKDKRK